MTAAAAAAGAGVRSRRGRVAASADVRALGLLAVAAAVLAALTWRAWGNPASDTGYDLVAGMRVAHGDLPYVDFIYYYGPLGPLALGLVGWLGGGGLAPAVGFGIAVAVAIVLATYALARTLCAPLGAALAAGLVAPLAFGANNFSYVLPHTESAPLGLLGLLCALLALRRYEQRGSGRSLVAAGAAAGAVALTRPEFELAVLAAVALWLVLRWRDRTLSPRAAALVALPAAAIPAVVYGAFLAAVSPHRLVLDNLYPREVLQAGGNHVLRIQAPLTPRSFAHLAVELVLYAAGCAVLVLVARRTRPNLGAAVTAALAAGGALALLQPDRARYGLEFVYGWIPLGAVLALAIGLRRRNRLGAAELAGLAALAVLAVKTYAAFYLHAPQPQLAVYAAPLAAIFLVRLHGAAGGARIGAAWLALLVAVGTVLAVDEARAKPATISDRGGSMRVAAADAPAFRGALAWIDRASRPGEPILAVPQLSSLYVLSQRREPLPQLSLLPGALPSPAAERQAIANLDRAGVRVAITDRRTFPEYGYGAFGSSFDALLAAWIRSHFRHAAAVGTSPGRTFDVWTRRQA